MKNLLWGTEQAGKSGPKFSGFTKMLRAQMEERLRIAVSCGSVLPTLHSYLGLCKMGTKALAGQMSDCTEG